MMRWILAASTVVSATAAQAATLAIAPGVAVAGEGRVTSRVGLAEERFDGPGCQRQSMQISFVSTLAFPAETIIDAGSALNRRLTPADDTSCYLSVGPAEPLVRDGATSAVFETVADQRISYFGFYLGSIDEYQSIEFFEPDRTLIIVTSAETGQPIVVPTASGTTSGLFGSRFSADFDQPLYGSYFFELTLSGSEPLGSFLMRTSNFGIEIDNLAWEYTAIVGPQPGLLEAVDAQQVAVPSPLTLPILGAGLVAVGFSRRGRPRG